MNGTLNGAFSLEPLPTQPAPCPTAGATSAESLPVLDAAQAEQRICDPSTFTNLSSHGDLMARYNMQLGSAARLQDDDPAATSLSPKLGTIISSSLDLFFYIFFFSDCYKNHICGKLNKEIIYNHSLSL